ncbi:MAG: heparan-alpha-glucosaminide N-acetyltransferase domain-containing protein [Candidatus Bathyarchaeota archaeon]
MSTATALDESIEQVKKTVGRFEFLDFARGLVMIIMAWDHVSGFWNEFHHGSEGIFGQAPPFVNTLWFLLRFVSHYCAPTFILLAGTVLAISTARRIKKGESEKSVSLHLIKRGMVLLFLEAALVSPAFSNPWTYFGVIACIGVCLIIFSVARKLPTKLILAAGVLIVLNHSFLDLSFIPTRPNWGWYLRVILHEPNFQRWPYVGLYPIIPWLGVMSIGWAFGNFLESKSGEEIRKLRNPLYLTGIGSIIAFVIVRYLNGYGNLIPRMGNTLVDWLYVSKYPPSVAFLLWTLGGMCLMLGTGIVLEERGMLDNRLVSGVLTIGRNPLFFYLVHLWLYRARWPDFTPGYGTPPFFLDLPTTLLFWAGGIVVLWYLCREYEKLKRQYPKPILQYI